MWTWITDLQGIDAIFFGCAAVGGALFLIRIVLAMLGMGDHGADLDGHDGFDSLDTHGGLDAAGEHGDIGVGFVSITGLSAFVTMFGLTGLAMRLEEGASPMVAVGAGVLVGLFAMWGFMQLFRVLSKLKSSGNVDHGNAVGEEAKVYLSIPAGGRGQVEVRVQGRLRVMDAVAEQPVEIRTGAHVRVVRVIEGNVLVVERA